MRYLLVLVCAVCTGIVAVRMRPAQIPPQIIVLPVPPLTHDEPCWRAGALETCQSLLLDAHLRTGRCLDLLEVARDAGRSP